MGQLSGEREQIADRPPASLENGVGQVAFADQLLDHRRHFANHVETGVELTTHAFERNESFDQQREIGWQEKPMRPQEGREIRQRCAKSEVFEGDAVVLIDEGLDFLRQVSLVRQAIAAPVEQHVDNAFRFPPRQAQQKAQLIARDAPHLTVPPCRSR